MLLTIVIAEFHVLFGGADVTLNAKHLRLYPVTHIFSAHLLCLIKLQEQRVFLFEEKIASLG